ncbi:DddA-like double-stranded DNA deaminase toxin [Kribbella catacumbae]|uniref:DddA-like double-stranded DNA deaminase toxin n=1 Tax=Kribbella catacumbae TaxID=460086 RepID=UPI000382C9D5|nr:DddA-like double-stranded DNA deaminase toxin [Kribbella catacumbae]
MRENDVGKTRGLWAPPDKEEMPLVSGYGHYQRLADEHARRLGLKAMRSTSHVEVKFALFMRERGLRDETIYINNRPCRGEASCPRWIESFLPEGAKLTVHWLGGGPWTFTGKGEP